MLQVEDPVDVLTPSFESPSLQFKAICPTRPAHFDDCNEAEEQQDSHITEINAEDAEENDFKWMDSVANPARWIAGRPPFYYPTDPRLPWHFSWIDDGMIGGMSCPAERFHYPALLDAGVGLIVNLTESPVSPQPIHKPRTICRRCDFLGEMYTEDLFDEISPSDDLQVLFLPMPDGSIPSYTQLRVFNKHAREFIRTGRKVGVHCQAGVGRTGTFLAIYLLEKYRCTAEEALQRLRWIRPQSLQFHRVDYCSVPFGIYNKEEYNRNLLQERFVWRYWDLFIRERGSAERKEVSDNKVEAPIRLTDVELAELNSGVPLENQSTNNTPCGLDEVSSMLTALIDAELDQKIAQLERYEESLNSGEIPLSDESLCYPCRGVFAVGPMPIKRGCVWPSPSEDQTNAEIGRMPSLAAAAESGE